MAVVVLAAHQLPKTHWAYQTCDEYLKRLPAQWKCQWHDIKPATRSGRGVSGVNSALDIEHKRFQEGLSALPGAYKILLDERGCDVSTVDFARQLARWCQDHTLCGFFDR